MPFAMLLARARASRFPMVPALSLSTIRHLLRLDATTAALTPAELEAEFGPRVCRIVQEVTDDKSMEKAERKRRQIVHASELSNDAVIVKLADKIANVQDITDYPPVNWELERRVEYLDWAKSVVSNCPVANQALLLRFHEVLNNAYEQLSSGTT